MLAPAPLRAADAPASAPPDETFTWGDLRRAADPDTGRSPGPLIEPVAVTCRNLYGAAAWRADANGAVCAAGDAPWRFVRTPAGLLHAVQVPAVDRVPRAAIDGGVRLAAVRLLPDPDGRRRRLLLTGLIAFDRPVAAVYGVLWVTAGGGATAAGPRLVRVRDLDGAPAAAGERLPFSIRSAPIDGASGEAAVVLWVRAVYAGEPAATSFGRFEPVYARRGAAETLLELGDYADAVLLVGPGERAVRGKRCAGLSPLVDRRDGEAVLARAEGRTGRFLSVRTRTPGGDGLRTCIDLEAGSGEARVLDAGPYTFDAFGRPLRCDGPGSGLVVVPAGPLTVTFAPAPCAGADPAAAVVDTVRLPLVNVRALAENTRWMP